MSKLRVQEGLFITIDTIIMIKTQTAITTHEYLFCISSVNPLYLLFNLHSNPVI